MKLTAEEFKEAMQKIHDGHGDIESDHADADKLMCELLTQMGYGEGIEIYERMPKWYA